MVAVAKRKPKNVVFGRRLREIRIERGLTLDQLGRSAEMAATAIARFERGERVPNWESAVALASALGVPLDAFKSESQSNDPPPANSDV